MAVDIDWSIVEQVEDLDKPFKKALAKAEEAEEPAIRLEWAEAKGTFYQKQSERTAIQAARDSALVKYPRIKGWEDEVRGGTAAEIEASAKRINDRLEANAAEATAAKQQTQQTQQEIQAQAQQQYGAPAAAGGGSIARPSNELTAKQEAINRVHAKLQKGEGLQRGGDKMDVITMASERLREAIDFQREAHPELGLGVGGSYRGESSQDRTRVDARVEARKAASRK
jgi:hypothetical protein